MVQSHKKIAYLFLFCYGLLLFATYPLAIIPPGYISLAYHISLPSVFIASLFSLPVIFSSNYWPQKGLLLALTLILGSLGFNFLKFQTHGREAIEIMGSVTIPLAISTIFAQTNLLTIRRLSCFGFYFWLSQIIHGSWSLIAKEDVIGFPGNRNWMASLLLALTPWSYFHLKEIFSSLFSQRNFSGKNLSIQLLSFIIIGSPTFYLMQKCASRGAWLSIIILILLLVFYCIKNYYRWLFGFLKKMSHLEKLMSGIVLILGVVSLGVYIKITVIYFSSSRALKDIEHTIRSDVRLPMWSSTFSMIKDNDIILSSILTDSEFLNSGKTHPLGIGAGRFTKAFAPYRSRSTYHDRLVAAPVTVHPHNEFLNYAAQIGFVPALAWLFTLFPLLFNVQTGNTVRNYGRCSAFVIYFHGFFDMPLVQPPGNLIAFFCLGLCWVGHIREINNRRQNKRYLTLKKAIVSLSLLSFLCGSVFILFKDIQIDWYTRNGVINEAMRNYPSAFENYRKATAVDPENVRSHLFAGTLALDKMHKPDLALPIFKKAYEIDPNFAHLNAKIGQAMGSKGGHKQALPFFIKECKLFPKDPRAFQGYFINLLMNGNFTLAFKVSEHLGELYGEKVLLKQNRESLEKKINHWWESVKKRDMKGALEIANDICSPIHKTFIDPLLYVISDPFNWPRNFSKGDFNELDYLFWRQLEMAKEFSVKTLQYSLQSNQTSDVVQELLTCFNGQVKITSKLEGFQFPEQVLKSRIGNSLSCYVLFCNIAYQSGFSTAIQFDNKNGPMNCLLKTKNQLFSVDLKNNSYTEISDKPPAGNYMDPIQESPSGTSKLCFMPQEFLLKNQILGTLVANFGKGDLPKFHQIPTLRLLQDQGLEPNSVKLIELKEYCVFEPIKIFVNELNRIHQ